MSDYLTSTPPDAETFKANDSDSDQPHQEVDEAQVRRDNLKLELRNLQDGIGGDDALEAFAYNLVFALKDGDITIEAYKALKKHALGRVSVPGSTAPHIFNHAEKSNSDVYGMLYETAPGESLVQAEKALEQIATVIADMQQSGDNSPARLQEAVNHYKELAKLAGITDQEEIRQNILRAIEATGLKIDAVRPNTEPPATNGLTQEVTPSPASDTAERLQDSTIAIEQTQEIDPARVPNASYIQDIGYVWSSSGAVHRGSSEGQPETEEEKLIREPFRHLAEYVTAKPGEVKLLHSTGADFARSIVKDGLRLRPGNNLLTSTARVTSGDRNLSLDNLLSPHNNHDSAVIISIPETLYRKYNEELRQPSGMFSDSDADTSATDEIFDYDETSGSFAVKPKYIDGYIDLKSKQLVSR